MDGWVVVFSRYCVSLFLCEGCYFWDMGVDLEGVVLGLGFWYLRVGG